MGYELPGYLSRIVPNGYNLLRKLIDDNPKRETKSGLRQVGTDLALYWQKWKPQP